MDTREIPLAVPAPPPRDMDTAALCEALRLVPDWRPGELEQIERSFAAQRTARPATFASLADPLSPWLPPWCRTPPLAHRSTGERVALAGLAPLATLLADGSALAAGLGRANHAVRGGGAGLRDRPVLSEGDPSGARIRFPEPAALPGLLDRIAADVRALLGARPALAAVAAMTMVAAAHPFADGNGRVSRILFNAIAAGTGLTRGYVPLYELGLFSDGGWLLGLRRAQVEGDWAPLIARIADGARLCGSGLPSQTAVPAVTVAVPAPEAHAVMR